MIRNNSQTTESFVWLPTAEQESLLKAALLDNTSAIAYWQSWTNQVRPQDAGLAEQRLFPLIYHNLQTFRYHDEFTEMLKRAHRESFKKTTLLLQMAGDVTSILKSHGIRTILLKGLPLAIQYYPSPAVRPMSDIDLMIEPKNVPLAVELLNREGWRTIEKNLGRIMEIIHSCQFLNAENQEMDLHWRLMGYCWNADKNSVFWQSAVPFNYQMIESETLCATDQLFHICCHGARYNDVPPIRWVADALMVLNSSNEIDWPRICSLGKTYRFNLPLFYTLRYLKARFNADIPDDILQMLEKTPTSRLERMSFRHFSEPPQRWSVWRFAQEAAFQYSSLRSSTNLNPRSLVFIKYLQHFLTMEKIAKKFSPPAQ